MALIKQSALVASDSLPPPGVSLQQPQLWYSSQFYVFSKEKTDFVTNWSWHFLETRMQPSHQVQF